MKDCQIEVIFSEKEYKFIERYSKDNDVHMNEVIRTHLADWLREWESGDTDVQMLNRGAQAAIVRGRKDGKRHSVTLTAVGSDGADWFNGQTTDESLSDDEPTGPTVQPNQ